MKKRFLNKWDKKMDTSLTPEKFIDMAKSYFDASIPFDNIVGDINEDTNVRLEAYNKSTTLVQQGYFYQKIALENLSKDLGVDVKEVLDAVKEAKETIKKIKNIGNMIELAAGLISLASIIMAPKPSALLALPGVINEIKEDVKNMK